VSEKRDGEFRIAACLAVCPHVCVCVWLTCCRTVSVLGWGKSKGTVPHILNHDSIWGEQLQASPIYLLPVPIEKEAG